MIYQPWHYDLVNDEAIKYIKTISLSAHRIFHKTQDISQDIDGQLYKHFAEAKNELANL